MSRYEQTIRDLRAEAARYDRAIAQLEKLLSEAASPESRPRRRGRISMGAEERQEVSQRMKRYWAMRRCERAQAS